MKNITKKVKLIDNDVPGRKAKAIKGGLIGLLYPTEKFSGAPTQSGASHCATRGSTVLRRAARWRALRRQVTAYWEIDEGMAGGSITRVAAKPRRTVTSGTLAPRRESVTSMVAQRLL